VARITRICSVALLLSPVAANARRPEATVLCHYLRARLADQADASALAVRHYAAALTAAPDDLSIASRAYAQAIEAGDYAVAVRAGQNLDRAGAITPDGHVLLYIAALRARDWPGATQRLTLLSKERSLGFLAPLFGRWLETVTQTISGLPKATAFDPAPNAYFVENQALIALSRGEIDDAVLTIKGLWAIEPYRAGSLRLAAASQLADRDQKMPALELIVADDSSASKARTMINAGRSLGVSVVTPLDGAAFILARVAGDLIVDGNSRSGLAIARMAEFAAPKNARIKLMVAGALAARNRHQDALAIADTIITNPLYGSDAASFRIEQLEALGKFDVALAEARARAVLSPNDQSRIGDIEQRRRNFPAAAAAYQQALDALGTKADWRLVFATANAYDNAGLWQSARPLLERALAIAPGEPGILNELGYGLVANGDDLDRGLALISQALRLRPDDAGIIDSLGWAQFKSGAFAAAMPLLEHAVRLDPTQPEIGEHLGDVYWAAERRIDARYAWAAAGVYAEADASERLKAKIAGKR
jgi:tetratricopeptide (TPR) repeat protein